MASHEKILLLEKSMLIVSSHFHAAQALSSLLHVDYYFAWLLNARSIHKMHEFCSARASHVLLERYLQKVCMTLIVWE